VPPHGQLTFKTIPYDGALVFEWTFIIHADSATPAPSPSSPQPQPTPPLKQRLDSNPTRNAPVKRQKKLDTWFKPGTIGDVEAYRQRTNKEWLDKIDDVRRQEEQHRIDEERTAL
jgi:hypothetical protein